MRSFLPAAIILFCTTLIASAQTVSLFNLDATQFPVMKANFFAFDAAGGQARPSASELVLTEDGLPRAITSVSCPASSLRR